MSNETLRIYKTIWGLALVGSITFLMSCSNTDPSIKGSAVKNKSAGQSSDCRVGRVGQVEVCIPHGILISGIQYKSPNVIASFDFIVDLASLAIQPGLPDLEQDQNADKYFYEKWMTVALSTDKPVNFRDYVADRYEFWIKDIGGFGPYKQVGDSNDLKHWVVSGPADKEHFVDEFFYSAREGVLITCNVVQMTMKPYASFKTCTHYFSVPQMEAVVTLTYGGGHVSRWREIQLAVTNSLLSFIIKI